MKPCPWKRKTGFEKNRGGYVMRSTAVAKHLNLKSVFAGVSFSDVRCDPKPPLPCDSEIPVNEERSTSAKTISLRYHRYRFSGRCYHPRIDANHIGIEERKDNNNNNLLLLLLLLLLPLGLVLGIDGNGGNAVWRGHVRIRRVQAPGLAHVNIRISPSPKRDTGDTSVTSTLQHVETQGVKVVTVGGNSVSKAVTGA